MTEKFGEIIPPNRSSSPSLDFSTVRAPPVGGLVSKWVYHFKTQTLQKQTEMYHAIVGLIEAQERALKARVGLERALVQLEFLDEIRQLEREKIQAEMELERAQIQIRKDSMLAELARSGANLHTVRMEAEKIMHPPPPPEPLPAPPPGPKRDPIKERWHNALNGGPNAREVEEQIKQFIKKKGGEHKLTEEDRDNFKNFRREAAKEDEKLRSR